MKISELIKELERMKSIRGDLKVILRDGKNKCEVEILYNSRVDKIELREA